jgi:AraC family transcriptional regulator of adaptative response/methylated-DNA-[protein]-cysteine methyltransferase
MYRAVVRRDASYEGVFIIAVKTTGVFCRPGCTARTPLRGSVEFFATARQAVLAGYRACKRCRPLEPAAAAPMWVRGLIERIERDPSERIRANDLRSMNIHPARASRWFKMHHGMTFQAYHRARRLGDAMSALRSSATSVNRAGDRSGFTSVSGFRDAFARLFHAPPGRAQRAGACLYARWHDTPLGPMLALADDGGVCLLEFVDRRMLETQLSRIRRRFGSVIVPGDPKQAHLSSIARELDRYFAGQLTRFSTPLSLRGTEFQLRVWNRLMSIAYGTTRSYASLAHDLGAPAAQRAVGRANGDNPLAIIIPCHRVIRADGKLCGYGGGLWRKKWLLHHEQITRRATS